MFLLLIFMFMQHADCMAQYVLYENPDGLQRLDNFGSGGKLGPGATLIWDADKDGPLPKDAPIGYADRVMVGGKPTLVEDKIKKAAYLSLQKSISDKAAQDAIASAALSAAKSRIKDGSATQDDKDLVLKTLVDKM